MAYEKFFFLLVLVATIVACQSPASKNNPAGAGTAVATTDSKTDASQQKIWLAFIREIHAANREFAKGGMDKTKALWSHGNDATIFGGFGGLVEPGWQNVEARLKWASKQFKDGSYTAKEIHSVAADNLGYVLQTEKWAIPGKPAMDLRVTMVCRKEGDEWKIVHRHGEMVSAPAEQQ